MVEAGARRDGGPDRDRFPRVHQQDRERVVMRISETETIKECAA